MLKKGLRLLWKKEVLIGKSRVTVVVELKHQTKSEIVLGVALFMFASLSLLVDRGISYGAAILFLVSLTLFVANFKNTLGLSSEEKLLGVGVLLFPISVLVHVLLHGTQDFSVLDNSLRFLLVIPIYFVVRYIQPSIGYLFLGVMVGSFGVCLLAIYETIYLKQAFADGFFQRIKFGGFSLLFAFFCLGFLLFGNFEKKNKALKVLSFLSFLSACAAAFLSLSRGAWLAAPVLILLVAFLYQRKYQIRLSRLLLSVFFVFSTIGVLLFINENSRERIIKAKTDTQVYLVEGFSSKSVTEGSAGTRLEMWRAAIILFNENPLIGVGIEKYGEKKDALIFEHTVAHQIYPFKHAHSDYMSLLAEQGILGFSLFVTSMLIFLGYFLRTFSVNPLPSVLGLMLVVSYLAFGITEPYFRFQESTTLFAVFLSISCAYCQSKTRQKGVFDEARK